MLDQAGRGEGVNGCADREAAVIGRRIGFFVEDGVREIIDRKGAARVRELIEHEAADRSEQQRLAGARIEADPAFVDFLPKNELQPFEKGCSGDVTLYRQKERQKRAGVGCLYAQEIVEISFDLKCMPGLGADAGHIARPFKAIVNNGLEGGPLGGVGVEVDGGRFGVDNIRTVERTEQSAEALRVAAKGGSVVDVQGAVVGEFAFPERHALVDEFRADIVARTAQVSGNREAGRQLAVRGQHRRAFQGHQQRGTGKTGLDESATALLRYGAVGLGDLRRGRFFSFFQIHPKPRFADAKTGVLMCSIGSPGLR